MYNQGIVFTKDTKGVCERASTLAFGINSSGNPFMQVLDEKTKDLYHLNLVEMCKKLKEFDFVEVS